MGEAPETQAKTGPAGSDRAADGGLARTVALIGLMGAGKSSVGRKLAHAIGTDFFDSDEEIEKAAGLTIQEIFARHGEPEFRRGERRVIERLLKGPPIILATGGGAYMDAGTRALMKERAVTVWLRADLETLWRRVSRKDHRPLLQRPDSKQVLAGLLETRSPTYALADLVVETGEGPHEDAVAAIRAAVGV